jgi:hypothetical protein
METIYYGHVPLVRNQRTSEGCPGLILRATRGDHNNIPYIAPPLPTVGPQSPLPYSREIIRARPGRGLERYRYTIIYYLSI